MLVASGRSTTDAARNGLVHGASRDRRVSRVVESNDEQSSPNERN